MHVYFEHETAVRISAELRNTGRAVKAVHEDKTTRWQVVGTLTNASKTIRHGEQVKSWIVEPKGMNVRFKFNHIDIELGYLGAIELGDWLRIRGKEAARNSQDFRHWTQIANA